MNNKKEPPISDQLFAMLNDLIGFIVGIIEYIAELDD